MVFLVPTKHLLRDPTPCLEPPQSRPPLGVERRAGNGSSTQLVTVIKINHKTRLTARLVWSPQVVVSNLLSPEMAG
jgi:hypothetical protein